MKRFISLTVLFSLLIIAGMAFAEEAKPAEAPAPAAVAAPAAEAPAAPAVPKIDTGDTAWMIVATALVMLMTIPGLALFYGGIAKRKDSLNTMAMSFVTFCIVSLLWVLYGFSFSFNGDISGFIGDGTKTMLAGIGPNSIMIWQRPSGDAVVGPGFSTKESGRLPVRSSPIFLEPCFVFSLEFGRLKRGLKILDCCRRKRSIPGSKRAAKQMGASVVSSIT